MSNLNRILTIRIKITDPEAAKWIWDAHMGTSIHGVQVEAIADGDKFEPDDDVVQFPKKYFIKEGEETTEEVMEAHCYGGFHTLEAAQNEIKNCGYTSHWEIIDQTGKVYDRSET